MHNQDTLCLIEQDGSIKVINYFLIRNNQAYFNPNQIIIVRL